MLTAITFVLFGFGGAAEAAPFAATQAMLDAAHPNGLLNTASFCGAQAKCSDCDSRARSNYVFNE